MSIIGGFTSLLLGRNDAIAKKRRAICNGCPTSEYGNSRWCKVSKNGCGCLISAKVRDKEEACPLEKWRAEL
jgi:hypothetical protein